MKKLLLLSLVILSASVSFAQNSSKPITQKSDTGKPQSLKLSSEQIQKLKEINGANRIAQKRITDDKSLTDIQKSQKIQELKNGQLDKLSKFLTPEQLEQFKSLKKED